MATKSKTKTKKKTTKAAESSLDKLVQSHTSLGLLCGELARDSQLPWKTRKIFESYAWAIFEQVKALRATDLTTVPNDFLDAATREVKEAIAAGSAAKASHSPTDAALAVVETHQAIDAVDGILGRNNPSA